MKEKNKEFLGHFADALEKAEVQKFNTVHISKELCDLVVLELREALGIVPKVEDTLQQIAGQCCLV